MKLVTGGSGLAIGLARAVAEENANSAQAQSLGYPQAKNAVVLSGSCSVMTNKQVAYYKNLAASKLVDVDQLLSGNVELDAFVSEYCNFVVEHKNDELAPLVYATANPTELERIQTKYGTEKSSAAIEQFFAALSAKLQQANIERFIVAGGETSGIVTKSLNVQGFFIGPAIAPGVPWVRSINNNISLTLKSGNFGKEDFFQTAQKDFPV